MSYVDVAYREDNRGRIRSDISLRKRYIAAIKISPVNFSGMSSQLCRLICGKSVTFRQRFLLSGPCPKRQGRSPGNDRPHSGKAKPYRTSGGIAAVLVITHIFALHCCQIPPPAGGGSFKPSLPHRPALFESHHRQVVDASNPACTASPEVGLEPSTTCRWWDSGGYACVVGWA
jgi:hypothetical protein